MATISITKRAAAETIGTFALTFVGCAAVITNATHDSALGLLGIALAFGLVIGVMVISIGDVSGCHINPAVTAGFVIAGRMRAADGVVYWIAQCIGAILAALLLRAVFTGTEVLGVTNPAEGSSDMQCLALEAITTFFLMFVILCVATGSKEQGLMAGIAIGGAIVFDILFAGPISGASMNPARSLGPALIAGDLENLWIYLVGPLAGAAIAVGAWMTAVRKS